MHPPAPPISPPASPSVPATPSPACSLTASLQTSLTQLLTQHLCSICRQMLQSPVQLPCNHIFCSRCIREALSQHSHCPNPFCEHTRTTTTTSLTPLRDYDHALHTLRKIAASSLPPKPSIPRSRDRLAPLSYKSPGAKTLLTDKLKRLGLPITGSLQALAERYRRLYVCWNANLDAAIPKPSTEVIKEVLKEENAIQNAQQRTQTVTSPFFAVKEKDMPQEDMDDGEKMVKQGDGFEEMIKKISARKVAEKERKQKLQVEENNRHEQLDLLSSLMLRKSEQQKHDFQIGDCLVVNGVCRVDICPSSTDQVVLNERMGESDIQQPKRHKGISGLLRNPGNSAQMHFFYQQNLKRSNNGGVGQMMPNGVADVSYHGVGNQPVGGIKRKWMAGSSSENIEKDKNSAIYSSVGAGARMGMVTNFTSKADALHTTQSGQGMHQSNTTPIHDFRGRSQRGVGIQEGDHVGMSPLHPTQSGLVSQASPMRGTYVPETNGRMENSSVNTSPALSAELQQKIERNRQRAIELKRQFQDRQRLRQMRQPEI